VAQKTYNKKKSKTKPVKTGKKLVSKKELKELNDTFRKLFGHDSSDTPEPVETSQEILGSAQDDTFQPTDRTECRCE
jgi:hypothetical protein